MGNRVIMLGSFLLALPSASVFAADFDAGRFGAGADGAAFVERAARAGNGILVLQVGSDWCVSGEDVRKVFESSSFRRAVGPKFAFAVYDDMDEPDAKTAAANESLRPVLVRTKRFPAMTCVSPPPARLFAQFENLPRTVTPEKLAAAVAMAAKTRLAAERLFAKGESLRGARPSDAADAYGAAFDMLERQTGEFCAANLRDGPLAYAKEWQALRELDADDRYGWARHFTMGCGIDIVAKANDYREEGDFDGGDAYITMLRKIPQTHFSANQRQCVDMAEYALWRKDASRAAENNALLEHAFALGRDTLWGQCAMGYLILSGKKIERRGFRRAEARPRKGGNGGLPPRFPLDAVERRLASLTPRSEFSESQKADIALAAVLRLIGRDGWNALMSRAGSRPFASAFFRDRAWMEDFAWSGPCAGAGAILALESLVFQDGGRWTSGDGVGRRFATAVALEYPGRDETWLADFLDAYRSTAEAGRLHRRALAQPVWQWRFAVHQGQPTASVDDAPAQQRFLSGYVNMPEREYGGACWMVPYRTKNCFGESVQGPLYYEAWAAAGEWPKRRYSPMVGGVCGELSKFGSACGNAHGLPSCTAGQPAHCAYTRRLANGMWEIDYSVAHPTHMHVKFWDNAVWPYVQAYEGTFEGDRERRLNADRMVELARLAEARGEPAKEVEEFYRQACRAWPRHYNAWLAYGDWVRRAGVPLDAMRVWARGCARGVRTGRQPLWDLLTEYFARVERERGAAALADALVEFAPLLRQDGVALQEEADFKAQLAAWTSPFAGDMQLVAKTLHATLLAQYGTRDYFSQALGWGGDAMMPSESGTKAFFDALGAVVAEKSAGREKVKLDFAPLILGASKAGNMTAFRQLAKLQDRMEPAPSVGKSYPATDFGAAILSSEGMLRTSSTSQWDRPSRYARCIDSSPCDGNGFHTGKEKSPWAVVVLPGPAEIHGVVAENNSTGHNAARQTPIEVQLSEDGESWQTVFRDGEARRTYRADLRRSPRRALMVRVRRAPDAKDEVFHLGKIVVYGRRLY